MDKKKKSFSLDSDVIEKLNSEADKNDRSRSYIVNKILREYFKLTTKKRPKA